MKTAAKTDREIVEIRINLSNGKIVVRKRTGFWGKPGSMSSNVFHSCDTKTGKKHNCLTCYKDMLAEGIEYLFGRVKAKNDKEIMQISKYNDRMKKAYTEWKEKHLPAEEVAV